MVGELKLLSREQLDGVLTVSDRHIFSTFVGKSNGIGPQVGSDCVGPPVFGVNDHGSRAIL